MARSLGTALLCPLLRVSGGCSVGWSVFHLEAQLGKDLPPGSDYWRNSLPVLQRPLGSAGCLSLPRGSVHFMEALQGHPCMPVQHRPETSCKVRPTRILSLLTISKSSESGLYPCRIPSAAIWFRDDILSLSLFLCLEAKSQVLSSLKSVAHWQSFWSVPATVSSMDGSSLGNTHTDGEEESSSSQQTPVSKWGRKGSPLATLRWWMCGQDSAMDEKVSGCKFEGTQDLYCPWDT